MPRYLIARCLKYIFTLTYTLSLHRYFHYYFHIFTFPYICILYSLIHIHESKEYILIYFLILTCINIYSHIHVLYVVHLKSRAGLICSDVKITKGLTFVKNQLDFRPKAWRVMTKNMFSLLQHPWVVKSGYCCCTPSGSLKSLHQVWCRDIKAWLNNSLISCLATLPSNTFSEQEMATCTDVKGEKVWL